MFGNEKEEKRFQIVHEESTGLTAATILLDTITGVQYLFAYSGNAGGLTPLLGADGQPLIRSFPRED